MWCREVAGLKAPNELPSRMFWSGALARAGLVSFGSSLLFSDCADEVYGPPCINASYHVEFVERLANSDCPESMVEGWNFDVEPLGQNPPGECAPVGLSLLEPPPRSIAPGISPTGNGFDPGLRQAGSVASYVVDDTGCPATTMMSVFIPNEGAKNLEEALLQDTVVWGATTDRITDACGVPMPVHGHCTDYYRARMTKIADWDWEEQ